MPVLLLLVVVALVAPDLLDPTDGVDLAVLGPAGIWTHYRTWLLVDADFGHGYSPVTVHSYRSVLWDWFAFLDPKPWHKTKGPPDLRRFLDRPSRSGRTKGQRLAANTRLQYASIVCAFYGWAHVHEYLGRNPMAKVRLPKGGTPVARNFDLSALRQILLAAEHDDRLYLMCWLCYGAGLRVGEVARVRVEDIQLHHRHPHLLVRGKGRKERRVPLGPEVRAAIVRLLAAGGHPTTGPLVCSRRLAGEPMTPGSVSRMLSTHIRGLGIDGSGHGLRHSFAVELLEAAGEERLFTVSHLLGHASTRTTERVYVLGFSGEPEQVLAKLPDPRRHKARR